MASAKFYGTGRRKKSVARVYLTPGKEVEKAYYVPERVYTQENAGEDEDAAEGISG